MNYLTQKQELVERLYKAGHISFTEALMLMDKSAEQTGFPAYPWQGKGTSAPLDPYWYTTCSDLPAIAEIA